MNIFGRKKDDGDDDEPVRYKPGDFSALSRGITALSAALDAETVRAMAGMPPAAIGTKPAPEPAWKMAVGSLYGYRLFKVDEIGRLRPPRHATGYIWCPGENVARCEPVTPYSLFGTTGYLLGGYSSNTNAQTTQRPRHEAPAVGCHCGFYARTFYDVELIEEAWEEAEKVVGVVEGYGRAEIGTKGFRCAKAKVRGLWIPGRKRRLTERTVELYPDIDVWGSKDAMFHAYNNFTADEPIGDDFWGKA